VIRLKSSPEQPFVEPHPSPVSKLRLVVSDLDSVYCLSGIIDKTILNESHIHAIDRVRRLRHYSEPIGRTHGESMA